MEGVQRDLAISHALKAADAITAASCLASFRPGQMPAMPELDENSWHCRVDPGNVVGVAGDDGMTTLPGAEHDMYVNDVVMVSVRTHQPDAPRHAQRHDRDVDARRPEQPGETGLARTAPCLCDDFGRDADSSPAPSSRVQSCLHRNGLARLIERKKRASVESEPRRRSRAHPASLSSPPVRPASPASSSSASTCRWTSSGTGVSSRQAVRMSSRDSRSW